MNLKCSLSFMNAVLKLSGHIANILLLRYMPAIQRQAGLQNSADGPGCFVVGFFRRLISRLRPDIPETDGRLCLLPEDDFPM